MDKTISPPWAPTAHAAIRAADLKVGDRLLVPRGGQLYRARVDRVGVSVVDVAITANGHQLPIRVRGDQFLLPRQHEEAA